jgi:hypothetical protein
MVEMLVREFVPQAMAAGLDFSRLQRVNTKFHIRRGSTRRREGDVIWILPSEVSGWFRQHPEQGRLRTLFGELVRQAFTGLGVKVPQSINLLEMKMRSNLATIGETWRRQAMAEGKAEGKAEALVCLLVARFGALAPSLRTRIHRARLETLDRWFKRAIVASDLRSVFNSSR